MKKRLFPFGLLLFGSILGVLAGLYLGQRGSGPLPEASSTDFSERSAGSLSKDKSAARSNSASSNEPGKIVARHGAWISRLDEMLAGYNPAKVEEWLKSSDATQEMIAAALADLSAQPASTPHRDDLKAHLYRAWARLAPEAAWRAALADVDAADPTRFPSDVAGEIAKEEPESAFKLALVLGMGKVREAVIHRIFSEWGRKDIAGAVAYWNQYPELPADDAVIREAIMQAAETNPAYAASQALLLRGGNSRGPVLASVLIAWGKEDISAAIRWAEKIENTSYGAGHLAILVDLWASQDPAAALAYAQAMTDVKGRSIATRNAWNHWLKEDPDAAMNYLAAHASADMLDAVRSNFKNSTGALKLEEQQELLDRIPDEKVRNSIALRLVQGQVEDGRYPLAMKLLNSLPDSWERDHALRDLGEWWARDDAKSAADWLKSLPDSSDRDLAIEGYARTIAETNPQSALDWIELVGDEGVKEGGLKNIALQWLMIQPAQAEAWLADQSWIPQDQKDALRRMAATPGSNSRTVFGANVTNRR